MSFNTEEFTKKLQAAFPGKEISTTAPTRFWIMLGPEDLIKAVEVLKDTFGLFHLSTIVGEDRKDYFQANYLLSKNVAVSLSVRLDKATPQVPSIASIIPGALPYERELRDMFGIEVTGLIDTRRAVLPEDWPAGVYPLRKDVKLPRFGEEAPKASQAKA